MAKKKPYRVAKKHARRVRDVPLAIAPDLLYTLQEACQLLRISESTARRWIKEGRLRARKIGRDYRIVGNELAGARPAPVPHGELKFFGPANPLLALLGAGDSGKTDIAVEHDRYLADAYADESP